MAIKAIFAGINKHLDSSIPELSGARRDATALWALFTDTIEGLSARLLVTDITYIRTYEGWLYLAAVMDLYSRQIVGWATRSTMTSDLVLQALLAAVWKRKPGPGVMVHSDQGSQFTSDDWQSFLKAHWIGQSFIDTHEPFSA